MSRPFPLKASLIQRAPMTLTQAHESTSILSALPFFPNHDLEGAIARCEVDRSKEAQWALSDALASSLAGLDISSGWRGSRAGQERSYKSNLDKAMVVSRKVRRLTARIPIGSDGGVSAGCKKVKKYLKKHPCDVNTTDALLHAEERAYYKIGEGLLEAAYAMIESGLLSEAKIFYGRGRSEPERLMIRDAVFAAEDQTIEDMLDILIGAPNAVDEVYDDTEVDAFRKEEIEVGVTPLIFVNCVGTARDEFKNRYIVLEAVDFGSVDTLHFLQDAIADRDRKMITDAQDAIAAFATRSY